jgi:hypothetical protein
VDLFTGKHAQDAQHGETTIADLNVEQAELGGGLVVQGDPKVARSKVATDNGVAVQLVRCDGSMDSER